MLVAHEKIRSILLRLRTRDHSYSTSRKLASFPRQDIGRSSYPIEGTDTYPAKPIRKIPSRVGRLPCSLQLLKKLWLEHLLRASWHRDGQRVQCPEREKMEPVRIGLKPLKQIVCICTLQKAKDARTSSGPL